jgi:hypothetical protein
LPVIRRFDLAACQRHAIMLNCGMTTNPSPLPPITPTGFIGNREFILTEWRFLLFGLLMAFWSSLGQTFFISLFSGQIRAALDLSHGDFGTYYALATTASAISLIWLGKLADMMRLEKLAIFILGSLCVAAILIQSDFIIMDACWRAIFAADVWARHDDTCLHNRHGTALCCDAWPRHFNCPAWPHA